MADTSPDQSAPASEPTVNREVFNSLVANAVYQRGAWFNNLMDSRRDVAKECGYPDVITPEEYWQMFKRFGVATRVVEVEVNESWKNSPSVYETDDSEENTAFEEAWNQLGSQLHTEKSYHNEETGNRVWEILKKADVLSGIGQYGVILLGVDDGKPLSEPAEMKGKGGRRVTYIRAFPQKLAAVTSFETDMGDPRFGQPKTYLITFNDYRDASAGGATGLTTASAAVHWTRIVHVADNTTTAEWAGAPRMESVFNTLRDIFKVAAAAPEGYWKSCFTGLSLETVPQLGGDVEIDRQKIKEMVDDYQQGLNRSLTLMGMTAKTLAPSVIDSTPFVNNLINLVCITKGIPNRIFMGSERGELASGQDDSTWNDRLTTRRHFYLTPRLIVSFIDRLINLGVLPAPKQGYKVTWEDLATQTDAEKGDVAGKVTTALSQYVSGGLSAIMVPMDFLTKVLWFTQSEAEEIVAASQAQAEEDAQTAQDQQDAQDAAAAEAAPDPATADAAPDPSADGLQPEGTDPMAELGAAVDEAKATTNAEMVLNAEDGGHLLSYDGLCVNCGGEPGPGACSRVTR